MKETNSSTDSHPDSSSRNNVEAKKSKRLVFCKFQLVNPYFYAVDLLRPLYRLVDQLNFDETWQDRAMSNWNLIVY
jgi:hypothetical protein